MPAVQRNGRSTPDEKPEAPASPRRTHSYSPQKPSALLLLIYPVILALGSAFSLLSPIASPPAAPLAPGVVSDLHTPPHTVPPPNYFAGKTNIVNLYFVKIGWFWTTLAFVLLQFTTRPASANAARHYLQAALRWSLVTLSWLLVTQWFFGPALIDRSFTLSGGHCEAPRVFSGESVLEALEVSLVRSAPACKAVGGRWRGGYDISGHVFMLVLSSAFLLYELHIADQHSAHPSVSPSAAAKIAHNLTDEERRAVGGWESETVARIRVWTRYFLYVVVALDVWMLLMTAIWFHTWVEKLGGLLIAGSTVWATFFLGDFVPFWRGVVGGV